MAISWKRNAAHAPASAHLPVAARHRAISRKGRRALRIREKYLSRGGFLRCVRVKSPHSGRNDIMGQCVHRCHFERSREIPCGRNGTTRTRASPFAGGDSPPAGSPCGQVVGARTYPLAERGRCVPRPAGKEPLRASRRCQHLPLAEHGRCVPRPAANRTNTTSFRPKRWRSGEIPCNRKVIRRHRPPDARVRAYAKKIKKDLKKR